MMWTNTLAEKRASLRWLVLLLLALPGPAWSGQPDAAAHPLAERVLVIQNANSPVSKAVAADYVRRRGVSHTLAIACPDSACSRAAETIEYEAFLSAVAEPLSRFLADHPGIDFLVLTKGIPLRIAHAPQGRKPGPLALDSCLAAWQYERLGGAVRVEVTDPAYGQDFHGLAWANRFWDSQQRFSHARFGGYLVARLDGYTETSAKALVSRSLAAEQAFAGRAGAPAKILLDACPGFGFTAAGRVPHSILPAPPTAAAVQIIQESPFGEFNADLRLAAELLAARGVPVELEWTDRFAGCAARLAGYVSWGSNDPKYQPEAYHSLTFAPGALCETAVSTSARTFLPTQGGQSLIADLLEQGATGAKGYTDEPLLQAVASPSILFDRYSRGWTLAESYYAASRLVGWQDVVLGDPLGRAFPLLPETKKPEHK
jgi:hypothetical protein